MKTKLLFFFFLLVNSVAFGQRNFQNSLSFDGINDRVVLPNLGNLDTVFTIEYWIYFKGCDESFDRFFHSSNFDISTGGGNDSDLEFYYYDGNSSIGCGWEPTGYKMIENEWTHIAWVNQGKGLELYINGTLEFFTSICNVDLRGFAPRLGTNWADSQAGHFALDELRIWNIARTQSEIKFNMDYRLYDYDEEGLVAYYDFNHGVAEGNNEGQTILRDRTDNNFDGILENFALDGVYSNWIAFNEPIKQLELPFEENFEAGTLAPIVWSPSPNESGRDGVIEIMNDGGVNDSKRVRIGKIDDGEFTTNVLDLTFNLTCYDNVELSFWIADNYDGNDEIDGIYFGERGGDFRKVLSFYPEEWCDNEMSQHPPIDIDELIATTNKHFGNREVFTIRFMQKGEDDFSGSNGSRDGFFIDNIKLYDPQLTYAQLPVEDDFETGIFTSHWAWNFADKTATVNSNSAATSPMNMVEIQRESGVNDSRGVVMGRTCDGTFSVNALDLYLDLQREENVELSFWIADNFDNTDEDDGIFFSDDGGENFTKVVDFHPEEWCDNEFSQFPPIDVDKLAAAAGLNLTREFVIRFQQRGENDFSGSSGSRDGILIDNVKVHDPEVTYANIPFFDDFETGLFNKFWGWNTADLTAKVPTSSQITSPINRVEIERGEGREDSYGVAMGRVCDDVFTVNALDLYLKLEGITNSELSFWIADNFDKTDDDDGIFFSDDGGNTFKKVFDFDFSNAVDNEFIEYKLSIDDLVRDNNLLLTNKFIIRFQQRGEYDFSGSSGNRDGIYLDDVGISEMTTSTSFLSSGESVSIYPNPTSSLLTINLDTPSSPIQTINIFDVSGKKQLWKVGEKGNTQQIDISSLSKGLFFLSLEYENGHIYNAKIIKE